MAEPLKIKKSVSDRKESVSKLNSEEGYQPKATSDATKLVKDLVDEKDLRQKAKRWDERKTMYRQNEDGTRSTHKMASGESDGKYYAHPTIFPKDPKGTKSHDPKDWVDLGDNEKAAFDTARSRGELYTFKKDVNARKWAEGEYKKN